jgi:hypothetical protein
MDKVQKLMVEDVNINTEKSTKMIFWTTKNRIGQNMSKIQAKGSKR